jgi:hypothetical protein
MNKRKLVAQANRHIDNTFHPNYNSEWGPLAWILDSLSHATVELLLGERPETIARKFVKFAIPEVVRQASISRKLTAKTVHLPKSYHKSYQNQKT